VEPLHRVLIDIIRDRLPYAVADLDCARVVHAAPDPAVVGIRARIRDVRVGAARLTGGRQSEGLLRSKVAEENCRSRKLDLSARLRDDPVFRSSTPQTERY
jgi:hypothetical protein